MPPGLKQYERLQPNADRPPRLNRSPHPYSRSQFPPGRQEKSRNGPSSPYKPPNYSREEEGTKAARDTPRTATSRSTSESDVELEDERFECVRALPAPATRSRKGLRSEDGMGEQETPLNTPAILEEEHPTARGYFQYASDSDIKLRRKEEAQLAREKYRRRRRAELLRRLAEVLSLASICFIVVCDDGAWVLAQTHQSALLCAIGIFIFLMLLYPGRLLWPRRAVTGLRLGRARIPSAFDPAPLLYPFVLPILTALSIRSEPAAVSVNIALGLSSLPVRLVPKFGYYYAFDPLHWLLSLMPCSPISLLTAYSKTTMPSETLALLYPLHQCLLPLLYHLTGSSLLSTELQLLAVSNINLLLLSDTPQAKMQSQVLWTGGVGLFLLCNDVLRWNVALERIPSWRFRRTDKIVGTGRSFVTALTKNLSAHASHVGSDTDYIYQGDGSILHIQNEAHATNGHAPALSGIKESTFASTRDLASSRVRRSISVEDSNPLAGSDLQRSITAPEPPNRNHGRDTKHARPISMNLQSSLSLTHGQVNARHWLYALYSYTVIIALIVGPIRTLIALKALQGWEPFGWAIGYLFGNLPIVRSTAQDFELLSWIPLPLQLGSPHSSEGPANWVDGVRQASGDGNTRLTLFAYWATVIALGLVVVLRLPELAEVDTRRKVFHGMMVVMLFPTAFIDPCFLSLGLTLVLAVFLLLDLIRAAQLRPFSKPLARFLAPYTDGRDLRGPVIVSHIFLLIGCAIPFWLSLASYDRQAAAGSPWEGWELLPVKRQSRDLSMIAGVICVGMGDAAASLIGRRFGRHKWPWAGGKSLEGSAAFAGAVTLGLMVGKVWLLLGGWQQGLKADDTWPIVLGKAGIAASGASFTEAVLTGANDNVVVPVILWLLVRGLGI